MQLRVGVVVGFASTRKQLLAKVDADKRRIPDLLRRTLHCADRVAIERSQKLD
jgi:hypothetical protein